MYQLPSELIINNVSELQQELIAYLSEHTDVVIDISHVARADTASIQLLCSLQNALLKTEHKISWHGESDAFRDAVNTLGLQQYLALS